MLIRKKYYMLIVVFLCMADSLQAEKESSKKLEKLSPEVIAAMEGNQKTIDSIHTFQALITRRSTHDYGEKGSRQLIEKLKIWYDGNNYRKDVLESKFVGKETEPLSLGEVEGGGHSYFKPPPVGDVEIVSTKSRIYYYPPTEYIGIHSIKERDKSEKIRSNIVLMYQSSMGHSLKEQILRSVDFGYYYAAMKEKIDEEDCILLACEFPESKMGSKVWVVPSKGHCIKKIQSINKDKVSREYTTTLKKYPPGIWWFESVKVGKSRRGDVIRCSEISVNSITFNKPIDPEIFTVWAIDVTPKTKVHDKIQGITYTLATDETENSKKDK